MLKFFIDHFFFNFKSFLRIIIWKILKDENFLNNSHRGENINKQTGICANIAKYS